MNFKYFKVLILLIGALIIYSVIYLHPNIKHSDIILHDNNITKSNLAGEYCTFYKCMDTYSVYKYGLLITITPRIEYHVKNISVAKESVEFNDLKDALNNNYRFSKNENNSLILPNIDLLVSSRYFPYIINSINTNERYVANI